MIKVEKNEKKFFQKLFQKIHFALILKMSVFWKIQKSFCEKKRFFWTQYFMVSLQYIYPQIVHHNRIIIISFPKHQKNVKNFPTLFFNFQKKNKKEYFLWTKFKK